MKLFLLPTVLVLISFLVSFSFLTVSLGYSGSDMAGLCREAALGPIRSLTTDILSVSADDVRPIALKDFTKALSQVRASVSTRDLDLYVEWNRQYGCLEDGLE